MSELKNLSIDDLDLDNGKFSIIGKGNKERTGYINKMTKKAIEEYIKKQLQEDIATDQISIKEYVDPFEKEEKEKERKIKKIYMSPCLRLAPLPLHICSKRS